MLLTSLSFWNTLKGAGTVTIDFILDKLMRWFDEPCNWSMDNLSIDEYMNLNNADYCNANCEDHDGVECWRKFLESIYAEELAKRQDINSPLDKMMNEWYRGQDEKNFLR